MGVLESVKDARERAWQAGLDLDEVWGQAKARGLKSPVEEPEVWRRAAAVDSALESLCDALTLDGAAPRPTQTEARVDLMRWGVDEGHISVEQYEEWAARDPLRRGAASPEA